jgi:hypothetical protein
MASHTPSHLHSRSWAGQDAFGQPDQAQQLIVRRAQSRSVEIRTKQDLIDIQDIL